MKIIVTIMILVTLVTGIPVPAEVTVIENDLVTVNALGQVWEFYGDGFVVGQNITVEIDCFMRIVDAY